MAPQIHISGLAPLALAMASGFASTATEGECRWAEGILGLGSTAMLIPINRIAGRNRLVISLFFDSVTNEMMEKAERIYRERGPITTGYFNLWQNERALRERAQAAEAAFDHSDTGFLLLDRGGDVVFANVAAQKMLDRGDGLRRIRRSVGASRIPDSVTLQVALNHVIASLGQDTLETVSPMVALQRDIGPPLIALLLAIPSRIGPNGATIAMYVNDPALDIAVMLGPICRLYRLSPVETTLVTHLAQGLPLAEAAKRMRVRELTARTYMKQIFLKTDTNRQTDLVILMLSSVVRMRPAFLERVLPLTNRSVAA